MPIFFHLSINRFIIFEVLVFNKQAQIGDIFFKAADLLEDLSAKLFKMICMFNVWSPLYCWNNLQSNST